MNFIFKTTINLSIIFISIYTYIYNDSINIMFLLPLTLLIFFILCNNVSKSISNNIGFSLLYTTLYIRYALGPLFLTLNNNIVSRGRILEHYYINQSIMLMIYELFFIFLTLQIFCRSNTNSMSMIYHHKINSSRNVGNIIYLIICLILIIIYPQLLSRYSFVLFGNNLADKEVADINYSILPLFIQVAHLIIIMMVINSFYKMYQKNEIIIFPVLAVFCSLILSSFMIGTSRFSTILPLLTSLFTIFVVFKKYRKFIFLVSVLSSVGITLLATILKQNTIDQTSNSNAITLSESINTNIQLYFSGIINVGHSIKTSNIYETFNLESIINDLTNSIVIVSNIFNSNQSALISFNRMFYNNNLATDQILPMIGQGYLYFGFFGSTIFTIISVWLILTFNSKINSKTNLYDIFIYSYITIKLSLFLMGNMTINLAFITNFFLLLLVVNLINKKVKFR